MNWDDQKAAHARRVIEFAERMKAKIAKEPPTPTFTQINNLSFNKIGAAVEGTLVGVEAKHAYLKTPDDVIWRIGLVNDLRARLTSDLVGTLLRITFVGWQVVSYNCPLPRGHEGPCKGRARSKSFRVEALAQVAGDSR